MRVEGGGDKHLEALHKFGDREGCPWILVLWWSFTLHLSELCAPCICERTRDPTRPAGKQSRRMGTRQSDVVGFVGELCVQRLLCVFTC